MAAGRSWTRAGGITLVALALLAFVPAFTGHPLMSYPVSRSMEPGLGPFDVFFVDPFPVNLQPGDVILFDSVTQGGPAVHRIVERDGDGWITKGDANEDIDQLSGEPIVTRDRVMGRVLTDSDGNVLRVPQLGILVVETKASVLRAAQLVGGPERLVTIAFAAIGITLALPVFSSRPDRRGSPRPLPRRVSAALRRAFPRGILGRHVASALLVVFILAAAWGAHRAHAEATTTMIVVSDKLTADPVRAQPPGGSVAREFELASLGFFPTLIVLESGTPGLALDERSVHVDPFSKARVGARQTAGTVEGVQEDVLVAWRYPAFLPESWIVAAHDAAPGLPYFMLAGLMLVPGVFWYQSMGVHRRPVGAWLGLREGWL